MDESNLHLSANRSWTSVDVSPNLFLLNLYNSLLQHWLSLTYPQIFLQRIFVNKIKNTLYFSNYFLALQLLRPSEMIAIAKNVTGALSVTLIDKTHTSCKCRSKFKKLDIYMCGPMHPGHTDSFRWSKDNTRWSCIRQIETEITQITVITNKDVKVKSVNSITCAKLP